MELITVTNIRWELKDPHDFIILCNYLREEILFLPAFVCLFVCEQLNAKTHERISMKFSGNAGDGPRRKRLDFGSYR